jgi:hypothetical protein
MASAFDHLPLEIQRLIAGYLAPPSRLHVARCSRLLYHLYMPLLYEKVFLHDPLPCRYVAAVVRNIIRDPGLAVGVQWLQIAAWEPVYKKKGADGKDKDSIGQAPVEGFTGLFGDTADVTPILEKVKLASPTDAEEKLWTAALSGHDSDAWVGLLLTLVPNLRFLEIQLPVVTKYVPWVIHHAANGGFGPVSVLRALSTLRVHGWDTETGLDFPIIAPAVKLPSLRRFSACHLADSGDQDPFDTDWDSDQGSDQEDVWEQCEEYFDGEDMVAMDAEDMVTMDGEDMDTSGGGGADDDLQLSPDDDEDEAGNETAGEEDGKSLEINVPSLTGPSGITHIELQSCNGGLTGMRQLIVSCKHLLSFKYNHGVDPYGEQFATYLFHPNLLHTKHTLRTLWLDYSPDCPRDHQEIHDPPLPSFREFTALKYMHLRCGHVPPHLTGWLPPSIAKLQVAGLRLLAPRVPLNWTPDGMAITLEKHVRCDLVETPALAEIALEGDWRKPRRSGYPDLPRQEPKLAAKVRDIVAGVRDACAEAGIVFVVHSNHETDLWGEDDLESTDFVLP